jgi:hypothetical protein
VFAAAICAVLLFGLGLVQAQDEAPEPGAEHQKLGYFVGSWTTEAELMENPFMPAGKFTSTSHCDWFEGGFSVVCKSEGKGPMGATKELGIMGYSTDAKVYTYYGIDNGPMAMLSVPRGTVDGDTWVYDDESMMDGKRVKSRYTIVQKSATSYTFVWAMAGEDGKLQTMMKGTSTKAK